MANRAENYDEENSANEEANIFSNEDISQYSLAKGNRCVPSLIAIEFIKWFAHAYPEILSLKGLSLQSLARFVEEFECIYNLSYRYELSDWKDVVDQYG